MTPREDEEGVFLNVWMEYALEDLRAARAMLPLGLLRTTCFHAQQAAEKALKGYLASLSDDDIPRTHDLLALRDLIVNRKGLPVPAAALRLLNQHAVTTRYPVAELPTEAEAREALAMAEEVAVFVRIALPPSPAEDETNGMETT